jgi:very-short-patch-repair endonuclease
MGDRRAQRQALIAKLAGRQGNVLSRRQLYELGITRSEVRAEVRAERWKRCGAQTLEVGPANESTAWWRAVLEVGPGAVLDGISALQAAGLRTITADAVHVAVPKSTETHPCPGVRVHETRRYRDKDVIRIGIPRMKPATAVVHAALWARIRRASRSCGPTDDEASLFVVASVQQRLVTVPELAAAIALVKRDKRRLLLHGLLADVSGGIESIGEREFAAACRRRGFPEPTRQVRRTLPSGRVRYDNVWDDYELEVEIDGAQHRDPAAATRDALKQNAAALTGRVVLRIPNFAFRTNPKPFLDQIEAVLVARGWKPPKVRGIGRYSDQAPGRKLA